MAKPDWEAIETAYRAGIMDCGDRKVFYSFSRDAIGIGMAFK